MYCEGGNVDIVNKTNLIKGIRHKCFFISTQIIAKLREVLLNYRNRAIAN